MSVVVPASPAWAHGVGGPSGSSNYRSELLGVNPSVPGVTVKVLDDGGHIQLSNTTTTPLVILGYSGEPYLMVDSGGVWQNARSPSLYLNRSSTPGLVYMPPGTDAQAPPLWQRTCSCDVAVWHDHRIHWGHPKPPPAVSASPGRYHLIDTWQIKGLQGGRLITISGDLSWVPGPSPAMWLGIACALAFAVAALGLLGSPRRWGVRLALALLALVAVDVARASGMVAGRSGSFGSQLQAVPYDGVFPLVLWLACLAVAVRAGRGRMGAAYASATLGLILALTGPVAALSVLWHSQVITAYPADLQRGLVGADLGISVGMIAASIILIARQEKSAVSPRAGGQRRPLVAGSDNKSRSTAPPALASPDRRQT